MYWKLYENPPVYVPLTSVLSFNYGNDKVMSYDIKFYEEYFSDIVGIDYDQCISPNEELKLKDMGIEYIMSTMSFELDSLNFLSLKFISTRTKLIMNQVYFLNCNILCNISQAIDPSKAKCKEYLLDLSEKVARKTIEFLMEIETTPGNFGQKYNPSVSVLESDFT